MGLSVSWVAFENTRIQDALRLLKLSDAGVAVDATDTHLSGGQLPNGWYVLFVKRVALRLCGSKTLRPLPDCRRILVCQVEEHVMASSSFACENGRKTWDIAQIIFPAGGSTHRLSRLTSNGKRRTQDHSDVPLSDCDCSSS